MKLDVALALVLATAFLSISVDALSRRLRASLRIAELPVRLSAERAISPMQSEAASSLRSAWRNSRAHGTGTPLGDPIEVSALTQAFRGTTDKSGFCLLGTVKSNFGHLEAAAGVTGLIKTALALEHGTLPPTLHFKTPNPQIDFANSPFRVVNELTEWPRTTAPRRAGVSSFGVGGTNAHIVLEEARIC